MTKEINAMEQFFIKYLKDYGMPEHGTLTSLNFKTCRVSNTTFLDTIKGDKFKEVEVEFTYHTNRHNHFKAIPSPNGKCALSTGILTQYVVRYTPDGLITCQPCVNFNQHDYCTISSEAESAFGSNSLATSIHGWCVYQ